ncbi:MAG: GNAT family N-acetyltransferase [Oscillospiraceae bacterium]|jgi:ribosomal protein S18 acetylase RimI-like enzyme|nr:GNAT family N-acetyltransferase [Oscillospiraceae bacterium]
MLTIRPYAETDEIFLCQMTRDAHEDFRNCRRKTLLLALWDGVPAGYLDARIAPNNCQIRVFVAAAFRRRGIGSALVREAERTCRAAGESVWWGYYYDRAAAGAFAETLRPDYTSSTAYMTYGGELLPENCLRTIRPYMPDDFLSCYWIWCNGHAELNRRLGFPAHLCQVHEPTEDIRREYDEDLIGGSFVTEAAGRVVGFGHIDDECLGSLAVDAAFRGQGFGSALAVHLTNEILRRGFPEAALYCEVGNDDARHIYEKIGYREQEVSHTVFRTVAG